MKNQTAAGMNKPSNRGGRKISGQNVQAFIQRENQLHAAKDYTRKNEIDSYKANWEQSQVQKQSQNGNSRGQKAIHEEIQLANQEVKLLRMERIKQFYENSYISWQEELNAKGLSFVKDR